MHAEARSCPLRGKARAQIGRLMNWVFLPKSPRSKKLLKCVSYIGREQKCGPKEFTPGYVSKVRERKWRP